MSEITPAAVRRQASTTARCAWLTKLSILNVAAPSRPNDNRPLFDHRRSGPDLKYGGLGPEDSNR